MKKILLLVSGLLILCMAGSAMAGSVTIVQPPDVTLTPGSSSFASSALSVRATLDSDYTIELSTTDGLQAYIGDSSDLSVGSASNLVSYNSPLSKVFHSTPSSTDHSGTVYVKLADPNKQFTSGHVYVKVYEGTDVTLKDIEVSSATITASVPEFPTIAGPVAAVLGLLFIIGRKKEGL